MRIAQVAPLYESVPPKLYGGTERVVSCLTEALVAHGHDVTLFASGDSVTTARLVPGAPKALRLDSSCRDSLAFHFLMFERILRERDKFDIVHFHTDYLSYSLARQLGLAHVTTLHGRLDLPELTMVYREFGDIPVVAISKAQQAFIPHARWAGVVYHGLQPERFPFSGQAGGYLAFLGRISPEKRLDRAIEIATRTGMVLRVAAKIDGADREYYLREIAPLLHNPRVEFIGEITEAEKPAFLSGAAALLFPIDWPEPFGLVLIESLACGTPVIAYPGGSVPEIITDGETGFLVTSIEDAVAAVERVPELSRRRCRDEFERRFTATRMMEDYLTIYGALVQGDVGTVDHARGGRPWTKQPYKTSSTFSPPSAGQTNEPAY